MERKEKEDMQLQASSTNKPVRYIILHNFIQFLMEEVDEEEIKTWIMTFFS